MKFPQVPDGLITRLRSSFPDKCPRDDPGTFELGRQAGQQQVIDLLERFNNKQKESDFVHGT